MKTDNYKIFLKRSLLTSLCFALFFLLTAKLQAQTDSTKAETITPSVEFSSTQKADNTIDLKTSMKAKINGSLTKLSGLKIEFYSTGAEPIKLGEAITDKNGIAILNTATNSLAKDTAGKLAFKCSFAGNKTVDAAEEVLAVKKGRLEILPVKEDSSLQLKLVDLSTGTETPVDKATVSVYVKRLFNPLKLGDGTTDETGSANVVVPKDIPGDPKGNLLLIGRVEENADYGNVEATVSQPWGIPVSNQPNAFPRSLWSASPPLWMLITFIVLMTTVWGHYIVIVYELFRLKREHD